MIEIIPYERVGPVAFDMGVDQVESVIGPPDRVSLNRRKERDERRGALSIRYSAEGNKVVEVSLLPSADVRLGGIDVFDDSAAVGRLIAMDGQPFESLGFIILLKLGITLTGFHDHDESQKAVTAFAAGRWDHLRAEFRPLSDVIRGEI